MSTRTICMLGLCVAVCGFAACDRADVESVSPGDLDSGSAVSEPGDQDVVSSDDPGFVDKSGEPIPHEAILAVLKHDADVSSLAYSPDGSLLATGIREGTITLWNTKSKEKVASTKLPRSGVGFFLPTSQALFVPRQREFVLLTVPELMPKATFKENTQDASWALVASPDGKHMALRKRNLVVVWDLQARQVARQFHREGTSDPEVCFALAYSPDGKTLAVNANDGSVALYDTTTWSVRQRVHPERPAYSVAFSPSGTVLATGALRPSDKYGHAGIRKLAIQLWDPATGKPIVPPRLQEKEQAADRIAMRHRGAQVSVAFSPNGRLLSSSAGYQTVKYWDVATQTLLRTVRFAEEEAYAPIFSPDGKTAAMGSRNEVHLLDVNVLLPNRSAQPPQANAAAGPE